MRAALLIAGIVLIIQKHSTYAFMQSKAFKDSSQVVNRNEIAILKAFNNDLSGDQVKTNKDPEDYWFDHRIHTLGNSGISGALHAALATVSTKLIDILAYDGIDIRNQVAQKLAAKIKKRNAKVIDFCCGVGTSTRALADEFPDVIGIDTSTEMVAMAKFLSSHVSFVRAFLPSYNKSPIRSKAANGNSRSSKKLVFKTANAENTVLQESSFDLITVFYAMHEAPKNGRDKMILEARRLLKPGGILAILDISEDYTPSESMLMGEPYVLEYQKNIHGQLSSAQGFVMSEYNLLVPGHVGLWVLERLPKRFDWMWD